MLEEYDKNNEGFYHNFKNEDKTKDNFLCFINGNDEAIGFIIYKFRNKASTIEIASVKESKKRNGIGKVDTVISKSHKAN